MNRLYSNVADVLHCGAIQFVPSHETSFYKFWWSQELDILKESFLSLQMVFGKQRVSHAVAESIKIVMSIEMRIEK